MQAKVRDNKLHISGYVNVPGRLSSRPVYTPKHGKVMETIEQRAFTKALDRTHDVRLLLDHLADRELASVAAGNLTLKEDRIGLRAETLIDDPEVVQNVDKLRGWSFQMLNVKDRLEQRADGLPIRHVEDFDMPEISLILHKNPVYASTSIELRSDDEAEVEWRAVETSFEVSKDTGQGIDYTAFENRISEARIATR